MPLRWFESDGTTPLPSVDFGQVGPGQRYSELGDQGPIQVILRNVPGEGTANGVTVSGSQVAAFPAVEYLLIAVSETEPDPGDFDGMAEWPVEVGTLTESQEVNVWLDMLIPIEAVRGLRLAVGINAAKV